MYKQNNPHEFELVLSPNFGSHFVEYQGKWVLYTREQDAAVDIALGKISFRLIKRLIVSDNNLWLNFFKIFHFVCLTLLGGKAESITLTTIATRKNDLKQMILQALEYSKMKEKGTDKGKKMTKTKSSFLLLKNIFER